MTGWNGLPLIQTSALLAGPFLAMIGIFSSLGTTFLHNHILY